MTGVALVVTTVDTHAEAETIAAALVERRLASCVQIDAVTSVYRWKDAIRRDLEARLTIKTIAARLPEVEAAIAAMHPYEVPEIVVTAVDGGSAAYLEWVRAECAGA